MEYKIMHIPISAKRRPGSKVEMKSITIHNTANPKSTALNERNWLVNPSNTRYASWHIAVDDNMAVEAIPLNEIAWHAGNSVGNRSSISIEICESGDQEKTWDNAVTVVAKELHKRRWDADKVVTHKSWSNKNCPRLILPRWKEFISDVKEELNVLNNPIEEKLFIPDWKIEGIEYLANHGLLNDKDGWIDKIDEGMPVWTAMLIMSRIHDDLKKEV